MKNRINFLLVFLLGIFNIISAQEYKDNLSDGILVINQSEKVPVKIFVSPHFDAIQETLSNPSQQPILVLLNKNNTEAQNQNEQEYMKVFFDHQIANGNQILDKNFKTISSEMISKAAYLLKISPGSSLKNIENQKVELQTQFGIWNPSEGINIFGFKLRFYGLMFVLAFGLGFMIMKKMFKIDGADEKFLDPLFTWTLFGTIFGARIGHVLFYDRHLFVDDFWSVFLPIRTKPSFEFTGFAGLASHGAAIALILTTLYYSYKIIKKNPFWVYDRIGIVVALAGFFIRMGNFFNSEIIGKPIEASSPFALLFVQQSAEYGATVPRYPTQLFEAFGYLSLFVLLWALYRFTQKKYQQGWLFGLFFFVLWAIRFFVEFLKEPQGNEYISFAGLNTGQILSLPFMISGLIIMIYSRRNKIKV